MPRITHSVTKLHKPRTQVCGFPTFRPFSCSNNSKVEKPEKKGNQPSQAQRRSDGGDNYNQEEDTTSIMIEGKEVIVSGGYSKVRLVLKWGFDIGQCFVHKKTLLRLSTWFEQLVFNLLRL